LAVILREYLDKNKPLPGMATDFSRQWPPLHQERPLRGKTVQNSGNYLASRQALLDRYARRWSLALHNQDIDLYGVCMFETCDELADRAEEMTTSSLGTHKDSVVEKNVSTFFSVTPYSESNTELHTAFVTLRTYSTTYFTTLASSSHIFGFG